MLQYELQDFHFNHDKKSRLLLLSLFVLLNLLLLIPSNIKAAVSHSSSYDWYTIESKNFRLHYHNGEYELAKLTINIAERVHTKLSDWIKWQPEDKTDLLLSDEFDTSNGAATPFPSNRSFLYVTPPDSISSLEDHANWLETLIIHEYLHILHLDKAINSASVWRTIFGRSPIFLFNTFPAASLPGWGIEGLATYKETDYKRGIGRGQSSYFNMLMRLEVEKGIKPIHQINQPISSWPMGTTSYLYGVNYYQFIEKQYGVNTINKLIDGYAGEFFPFRINNNTEEVVNKNLIVIWQEFEDYLEKKYRPKIKSIQQNGVKSGTQLTYNGYFDESLRALSDGRLFYVSYDALQNASLMKRQGNTIEKLARVELRTRLDVHPVAGGLMAQPTLCDNSQFFYDLYRFDLDMGDLNRITHCKRYRMASWSPDGTQIIAVRNYLGKNELDLLDATGEKIKTLWKGEQWQVVSHMDWSPDGKSLVAAVYREKSGWNLELFNFKTSSWQFLTKNDVIQNYPVYSIDGKSVIYSAEQDGVYNIFKLALSTKKITQLSNVIGAAFYPAEVNAKGDLYYIGHNTEGMDLYQLSKAEQLKGKTKKLNRNNKTSGIALATAPVVNFSEPEKYSPWSSLQPRWWMPILGFGNDSSIVGLTTSSNDILARHNYFTSVMYDFENEEVLGSLDYIYDRYYPILKLHYDRSIDILYGSDDKFARAKISDETQAEIVLPFLSLQDRFTVHFGVGREITNDARVAEAVPVAKEFQTAFYGISAIYNNSTRHARSISRNQGREITVTFEDSDSFDKSFYKGSVQSLDWREYIPLGGAHVFALRAVLGRGDSNSKPFQLGGSDNTTFSPSVLGATLQDSPFNRRKYNLRGYSNGLNSLIGNNINVISAEYRFPVVKLERSYMTPPVGVHEFYGALFYDTGAAWDDTTVNEKYYSGAGVELTVASNFFFHNRLNIVLGYAHGFDDVIGDNKTYLRLDASY
jgi:hypothetical protein